MSKRAIGDRLRLGTYLVRRGIRHAGVVAMRPIRAFRPRVASVERLVIAPQDLRTTDPTVAADIYAGFFAFAGKVAEAGGRSPFELVPPSDPWTEQLMGFGWLRHLRAADSALARANARALVDDWITACGRPRGIAWEPAIAARRVISWLSQSPLILEGADADFYRRFMRSLARQAGWLQRMHPQAEPGEARLQIALALALVALCTNAGAGAIKRSSRLLADELDRQILPDGGHIGRNPRVVLDLLTDLLPLRQVYANQSVEAPRSLLNAIDRMMPMLRLFRHGDGSLALFNGMGATPIDTVATVLAYNDARAQPIENAVHSGYQRLQGRRTVVVMDAGPAPAQSASWLAHAGCLAFELSEGTQRIVVNCGAPPAGAEAWRTMARSTAAHSTLVIGDTSSCHFMPAEGRSPAPIMIGPREVPVGRTVVGEPDPPAVGVTARHDGYRGIGLVHERRIRLTLAGDRLDGQDQVVIENPRRARAAGAEATLRFHLHPSVEAERTGDGRGVTIRLPNDVVWVFEAGGLPVTLEESVFLAAPQGACHTEQIVVTVPWRETSGIDWSFVRQRGASEPNDPDPWGSRASLLP